MANVLRDLLTWLKGWFYTEDEVNDLLELKQDVLVDGVNIATINSQSLLGGGDIEVGGGSGGGIYAFGVDSTVADDVLLYIDASSGVSYHLEFLEASYVAIGGVATVSVLVLENYEPVEDIEVTFSSDESTTTTATTGSDGVATATITFNDSTTLTATYESATATATITVQSYLLFDDCSTDKTSDYGSSIAFDGGSSNSLVFSTDEYIMSGSGGYFSGRELTALSGISDCKVRVKFRLNTTSSGAFNQFCIIATDQTPSSTQQTYPYGTRVRNDKLFQYFTITSESTIYTHSVAYSTDWFYIEAEKDGTSWTISLYDKDLNRLATNTRTLSAMTGTVKWYMVIQTEKGTNHSTHIKEIKAELLGS